MHEFFAGSIFPVHPDRREKHSVMGIFLTSGVDRHISKQQPLSRNDLPGEMIISDHISGKAGRSCQPPCPAVRIISGFMLLTSTPTHCSPRNFVSSGLPRSFPVLHGSEPCADPYGYASRSYPIPPSVIKKCRSLFCHRINFLVYTKNRLRICTTCLSSQSVFLFLQDAFKSSVFFP